MSVALLSLCRLTDAELTRRLRDCVADERKATAALLATLAEFDVRRLYLPAGFSSMFDYCTRYLHLSERAAGSRIAVARLARRFPIVLDLIADNRVSLTAGSLLARHLNEANYERLLREATHKTVSEVEIMVARLAPRPDVKPMVRRVPDASPVVQTFTLAPSDGETFATPAITSASAPAVALPVLPELAPSRKADTPARAIVKPLAPERYRIQFTISEETRSKLATAQDLLRHSISPGDIERVFDRALTALLADLEKRRLAVVAAPRPMKPRRATTGIFPSRCNAKCGDAIKADARSSAPRVDAANAVDWSSIT